MARGNGRLHMRLDGLSEKSGRRQELPKLTGHTFYWIWGRNGGRRVVWGPFNTQQEATQKALTKLSSDFEVIPLRTRDQATASRIMRARYLNETEDFDETFRNFQHTL